MDTTQKTREPEKRRPVSAPASAQQRNGAARTAQEQNAASRRKEKQPPAKKKAPERPEASKKKTAQRPETAPKKKAAPKKKQGLSLLSRKKPAKKKPDLQPTPEPEKRRRYGNSKPKKKSPVASISEIYKQYSSEREEKEGKQRQPKRPLVPTPPVIYTEPKTFNRNRLIVQLATVTAVVAAVVMGISVFFKVDEIRVSGAEVYSIEVVEQYSGIKKGDNLLTFSRPKAGALIKANLPYVDTVRFGIKLPGTVNIIIEEDDVVYSIKDQNGQWWLMNSDGRIVEQAKANQYASHTQILGVNLESPMPNSMAVAVEAAPTQTNADGELMPVTTENAQRLDAARQILQALEQNDIVGSAASVDVSRLDDIILWYGTRYQVNLGDDSNLDYKISCMNEVIMELNDYQSGILDISFTIWPNQVGYTPFS